MSDPLLKVEGLKKYFPVKKSLFKKSVAVKAVDDVSFEVYEGETLGIVGESGCGKSTMGRTILRLIDASDGNVHFQNEELLQKRKLEMRQIRKDMQMIFQDPYASLNPRLTIEKILEEPLIVHKFGTKEERKKKVREMIEIVGLNADYLKRYPHQFSGGQRQRVGIARALMTNPKLIIADEPVSALDVSIQSQILNLLVGLQQKFSLTYLFISHDLGVVRYISDRVAVMYLGRIVEIADNEKIYNETKHPYTQALLAAVPLHDPYIKREDVILQGDVPNSMNPPKGCAFHMRCSQCFDLCKEQPPVLKKTSEGHYVACHLYD